MKYGIKMLLALGFIALSSSAFATSPVACDPNCYLNSAVLSDATKLQACLQSLPCPTDPATVEADKKRRTELETSATKPYDDQIAAYMAWYDALPDYLKALVASSPEWTATLAYLNSEKENARRAAQWQADWEVARRSYVSQYQGFYAQLITALFSSPDFFFGSGLFGFN